jgi:hypothetical protein
MIASRRCRISQLIGTGGCGIAAHIIGGWRDPEEVRFASDSLVEGDGFEPSVPLERLVCRPSPPATSKEAVDGHDHDARGSSRIPLSEGHLSLRAAQKMAGIRRERTFAQYSV